MSEIQQHRIVFKREDNPDYFKIMDDYNSLIDRLNKFYDSFQNFKIPKFILFGTRKRLLKLGFEIREYDKSFIAWKGRALEFALDPPKLTFRSGGDVGYLHVTGALRDVINNGTANVRQLISDYNLRFSSYENRKNIVIGVIFFATGCLLEITSWFLQSDIDIVF